MAFNGQGKISKNVQYVFAASYTWSNPVTKDPSYVYYVDPKDGKESSFLNKSSDTTRNVLKYRIEHMMKLDLEFTFFKKFALGGTLSYYSSMKNVDRFIFDNDINNPEVSESTKKLLRAYGDVPFYNFYNFFHREEKFPLTLDLRASYYFDKVSLSFIVRNVTNRLYTLRPLYAEPPRTYTLQLIVKI